ncbi:MAG: hypothetical protein QM715_03115 [Nibricoccus sp.]
MFLFLMNANHDNLKPLLQSWNEVPAPTGRLAGAVWQRIEAGGGKAGWFSRLVMAIYDLDASFARPRAIAVVVAAGLLVGIGVGELRAKYDAYQIDSEMSARYLSMLDTSNR